MSVISFLTDHDDAGNGKTVCGLKYGAKASHREEMRPGKGCPTCLAMRPAPPPPPPPPPPPSGKPPTDLQAALNAGGTVDLRGAPQPYTGEFTISKPHTTVLGGLLTGRLFVKASDVTIDGLDASGSQAGAQQGTLDMPKGAYDRLTLRRVHLHHGDGTGLKIRGGAGHLFEDIEIDHMLQLGYGFGSTTDLVVRRMLVHECNYTDKYQPGWEAGGGKMVLSKRALFEDSKSWGNHGPGFWDDIDNEDTHWLRLEAFDNEGAGFMSEISFRLLGESCVGYRNGAKGSWVGKTNYLSHTATGTRWLDCLSVDAPIGFGIDVQQRNPDQQATHPVQDVTIVGSTTIRCPVGAAWADDWQDELYDPANRNAKANKDNRYWDSKTTFQWNHKTGLLLPAYIAATGETGSRFLTDAEKDAILAAHGL